MLYQINTRVWIRQFGEQASLASVPDSYWQLLADAGIQWVWLMGIWQTVDEAVHRYALAEELQREYQAALPDWTHSDLIGSPYAIDSYTPAASLGDWQSLACLRAQLHCHGMRLILDFVPNHFHAESRLLLTQPEIFLEVSAEQAARDPHTFYEPPGLPGRFFAHGKDPHYAAWQDTAQVNYARVASHVFMEQQLLQLAGCCDGLRCDMAMLPLGDVFSRTWGHVVGHTGEPLPDFWPAAIAAIKAIYPNFVMIAEVYWDLEWRLQLQGFDYTYDKRLLDRLKEGYVEPLRLHLHAELSFQQRSVRFLENHDEDRILGQFSRSQAEAAAVIAYTCPGLPFFYDGQWEGRRTRIPVQLGREPVLAGCSCPMRQLGAEVEADCLCTWHFYQQLLQLLRKPVQQQGSWQLLQDHNLLAWLWTMHEPTKQTRVVIVNYHPHPVRAAWPTASGRWLERFSQQEWVIEREGVPLNWYPYQYMIADKVD